MPVLRTREATPEDVERRLLETRNKFMKRLDQYCYLTQSRVPGPYLHVLPTINGVRLARELEQTRDLRHKIVHAGQPHGYESKVALDQEHHGSHHG